MTRERPKAFEVHEANGNLRGSFPRHQPQAVECFLLLAFLAYNLFHAFFALNLKPQLRRGRTMAFLVELIAAELHVLPRFSRITAPP